MITKECFKKHNFTFSKIFYDTYALLKTNIKINFKWGLKNDKINVKKKKNAWEK